MSFSEIVTFIENNWPIILGVTIVVSPICWIILHFLYKNRLEELNAKNENLHFQIETNKEKSDKEETETSEKEITSEQIEASEDDKKTNKKIEKEVVRDLDETYALRSAFEAFGNGEYKKGLKLIEDNFKEKEDYASKIDMIAFGQYRAFSHGATEAFEDLKKLASQNPNHHHVAIWLALSYKFIQEEKEGIRLLEEHLAKVKDESTLVTLTLHICNLLDELSKNEEVLKRLKEVYANLTLPIEKARILKRIGVQYEENKAYEKAFLFYERALTHNPTDTDLRFDVAYLYSNNSAPKFALYHYKKLLGINEHKMASNNAGVALGNLSLPILSTKYYKEAEKQDNTLASANLAYKLLDAGFTKEAEEILNSAKNKNNVHENVYSAFASLVERETDEEKKVDEILKEVENIRKWRHKYGNALLHELKDLEIISGIYDGKPGRLKISADSKGKITGQLFLNKLDQPAEISGSIEGSGIKFKWEEPPREESDDVKNKLTGLASALYVPPPPRKESGILIFENGKLTGYSNNGEKSLDPSTSIYSTEWELEKKE